MAKQAEKKQSKGIVAKIKKDNENGARFSVIEELFADYYRRRTSVYWMNFVRGMFFGFGSVLGGTLLIALVIWILSQVGSLVPALGDFIQDVIEAMNRPKV